MESQNHYYGHSSALARYVGLPGPRHLPGLVQHGWTATSPLETHFRDFPAVGAPGGRRGRSLFVWSHTSRAWEPRTARRRSVAIGAPWHYLCATLGPRPAGSGTVILPVHGIATQPLLGDHAAVARAWAETEGPATVCLYHVEADDPRVVRAYADAGHRVVTLGRRTDPAFLGRLHTLLTGAARVVSNRLSTPVVYAAAVGVDAVVSGDAMRLAGERPDDAAAVAARWPEFYERGSTLAERTSVARDETGADAVLTPDDLRALLGWDRRRPGPWLDHWLRAPAHRAATQLGRRASGSASDAPAGDAPSLSFGRWFAAATEYLPRPLGSAPAVPGEPLAVPVPD
ncbi:hypothetical protein [Cellulomonas iranensis]|uniref:hypothetical protein n=1 Tax=Cellulomonas iranensis TaxID=76862 RepID=UPI0011785366|nr:hypothetical protein [Cellulomonas iranensis]UCN15919.1 hypothetical protein LFM56_06290 [Cellulomonas iranensis]